MAGLMTSIELSITPNITDIVNHTSSVVHDDIQKINHEFYEGYQWIACIDSNTCLVCAALDNIIYDKLPGMDGNGTEPQDIPPIHKNCRCVITPVLEGMKDDDSQTKISYREWFDRQDRLTKIDILGPAKYKEYWEKGKAITSFTKNNKILTLVELKIDRITRQQVFQEIYEKAKIPVKYTAAELNNLYNDNLSAYQMENVFKYRYSYIEMNIAGKMPKEQLQILLKEYDSLLQENPLENKLMHIKVGNIGRYTLGQYSTNNSSIEFNRKFLNDPNMHKKIIQSFNEHYNSSSNINHVYIHELSHAIDRSINIKNKIGRQLLLDAVPDKSWTYYASKLSVYATVIPSNVTPNMYGGEFFAEAFTAYKNKSIPDNPEMKWIIDFFDKLDL